MTGKDDDMKVPPRVEATHVVLRVFTEVEPLRLGQLVDARNWPNLPALVRHGWVRPVEAADLKAEG